MGMVNERLPTGNSLLNWNRFLHNIVPEKYTQTPLIHWLDHKFLKWKRPVSLGPRYFSALSFCETEDKHSSAGIPFNGLDAEKEQMQFGDGEKIQCVSLTPFVLAWGSKAFRWSCQFFAFGPVGEKKKRLVGSILKDPEKILSLLNIVF